MVGRFSLHSYTNLFELETRFDGIKYEYAVTRNENTPPDIIILAESPTTEGNGTTIKFRLNKPEDFNLFKSAILQQLKYFRNIITVGFGLNNNYKIIQGENFIWRTDSNNTGLEIAWGNICYPIDWEFLGLSPINVPCALYFPTTTPFTPTVSRERLEATESNKKLILNKLREAKKELYDMWKEQQIVENFFEFINLNGKKIKIGEYTLDVTNIIEEEYIYKPLLKTNIHPKIFKQYLYISFEMMFFYRKNSRTWGNDWKQIGTNKAIYNSDQFGNPSQHRLSKSGWVGVVSQRPSSMDMWRGMEYFYAKSQYTMESNSTGSRKIKASFDYAAEVHYISTCIWEDIKRISTNLESIVFDKKETVRTTVGKEDVRGKFSDTNYTAKVMEVRSLKSLRQYKHVVYTNDQEEYDCLANLTIRSNKEKGKYSGTKLYLVILCSKKYNDILKEFMTYDQFLHTELLKKYYYKYYEGMIKESYDDYLFTRYKNLHKMYEEKYRIIRDELMVKHRIGPVNGKLYHDLKALHSVAHIHRQYRRIRDAYNEMVKSNDTGIIRYKLLYKFFKKQVQKQTVK